MKAETMVSMIVEIKLIKFEVVMENPSAGNLR